MAYKITTLTESQQIHPTINQEGFLLSLILLFLGCGSHKWVSRYFHLIWWMRGMNACIVLEKNHFTEAIFMIIKSFILISSSNPLDHARDALSLGFIKYSGNSIFLSSTDADVINLLCRNNYLSYYGNKVYLCVFKRWVSILDD